MAVFLAMADYRLDCRAAPEFLFDLTMHAALLAGAEDPLGDYGDICGRPL